MKSKINSNIRTGVQEVMDDFTWLESIRKDDEINRLKGSNLSEGYKEERCMICTLPIGSCEHNTKWMDDSLANRLIDSSELEIDSALEILGGNDRRTPQTPLMIDAEADVDLEHLCWEVFDDRPVDRIGEAKVHLFTPFGRFWHSSTNVGNFVVTFGGLQIRKEKIYQDIRQIEDAKDFEFLNDLRVYNNSKQSWHGVRANGNQNTEAEENEVFLRPKPRYGHAAAALDDRTLLMFGGRGEFNAVYGDTWIYDIEEDVWKEVDSITYHGHKVMPPPRFHSSMTAIPDRSEIYLFGGTNEEDLFGDLWVFRKTDMLWEKIITVGFSPTPRYGHVLLPIERQRTLIVIGGCTVSPLAEWEAQQLPEEVSIAQMHRKYQSLLDTQFLHLNKKLRGLSTTDYRIAEEKLFDSWQKAKAMSYYLKKTTKHTNPAIDISFYNIKDQMWIDRKFPKFSGEIPKSRMYFCAQAIGHYLFVVGGAYPTSLFTKCVDQNGQRHVDINVLDLRTHTWTKPLPINSDEYYKQTMLIAEADIIRAQKKLQAERLEGLSLGAPGGLTREVAIAQAMVNVCIWRKQQLENKTKEDFLSPNPIIGASFTAVRQRLLLVGGFTPGIGYRQDVLALSVENIYERERRLEEMYHAKLELDRKEEEKKLTMENLITSYELRAAIMEEKRNRERELQEMAVQDYLSSLPPLSYPNPVKLVKANHNTIWVEWDRVHEDSSGNQVDQKDIIYFLYMKSSIETLRENDEVLVEESAQNELTSKRRRRPFSRGEQYRGPKEGSYFSEFCHRYPGLIRKVKGKGIFDILYDDGSYEANVPRYRIKLNKFTAPQSPSSPSSVPSTASTARTSYTGHIPGLDLKVNTRKSLIEGIASNLQNQYTPKKMTSPKKLKLLQRLSFMKSTKANKLRHLHESSSKPMPLQGTILLHYPATLALHHPYPNSFLPPLSSRASSNPQTTRTDQSGFNREALYNPLLADIDELSSTQESIHSNSSFNFPINQYDEEIKAKTEQPTVKIDEDWRLIYVGNDNHYACSNIISQDIFESEVGIQAAVMFSVQVQGIDFPRYERSRLSKPMIYYTVNPAPTVKAAPQPVSVSVVKPDGNLNDGTSSESGLGGISKTKKEIITAVINAGQIIQIEKRGYYTYGEGVGDHYD